MNNREAMQQALEALEWASDLNQVAAEYKPMREAITALRAALAEPVQEPVAWQWLDTGHFRKKLPRTAEIWNWQPLYTAPPQREPIHQWRKQMCADWYDGHPDHSDGGGPYETRTLYTTPPQRKPLTDQEVHDCFQQKHKDKTTERRMITRAIERAHGI